MQDFLLDLLCRLPAYDAKRGSIGAFAGLVIRNRSARLTASRIRCLEVQNGGPLSMEAAGDLYGRTIATTDGLWSDSEMADASFVGRRLAVAATLGRLDESDRRLCAALAQLSVTEIVRSRQSSRSHLYRHLARLRRVFAAYGLRPSAT
ncbi:hypothetical protein Wenmar_01812 [Wenxinia marina DSM 24838]|uniref:Uncharacterized protein n=2 Tax=Wenxinia TaxID=653686 RepID=A0A0D0NMB2_9RHOB|nr:hypothetical protein Wenmar_01812 [Wenxinia marina DSM 24838]